MLPFIDTLWQAIRVFSPAMCTYLESCQPSRWIHAYFKPTMDGFKTTSNAAEQENNRLKLRHLRSCNLLDMLNGLCRIVNDVTSGIVRTALEDTDHLKRLTPYGEVHMTGARDLANQLCVTSGEMSPSLSGTFIVSSTVDLRGDFGCRPHVVVFNNGQYHVDDICQTSARLGLPDEHVMAVWAHHLHVSGDTSTRLHVHPIWEN
eukprot:SAG25_NODE_1034_length_4219_cov_3.886408_1_plen_203_part_10